MPLEPSEQMKEAADLCLLKVIELNEQGLDLTKEQAELLGKELYRIITSDFGNIDLSNNIFATDEGRLFKTLIESLQNNKTPLNRLLRYLTLVKQWQLFDKILKNCDADNSVKKLNNLRHYQVKLHAKLLSGTNIRKRAYESLVRHSQAEITSAMSQRQRSIISDISTFLHIQPTNLTTRNQTINNSFRPGLQMLQRANHALLNDSKQYTYDNSTCYSWLNNSLHWPEFHNAVKSFIDTNELITLDNPGPHQLPEDITRILLPNSFEVIKLSFLAVKNGWAFIAENINYPDEKYFIKSLPDAEDRKNHESMLLAHEKISDLSDYITTIHNYFHIQTPFEQLIIINDFNPSKNLKRLSLDLSQDKRLEACLERFEVVSAMLNSFNERGVFHVDMKLDNFLEDGKISDLKGLTCREKSSASVFEIRSQMNTTSHYWPPELEANKVNRDYMIDLNAMQSYQLGLNLYLFITGKTEEQWAEEKYINLNQNCFYTILGTQLGQLIQQLTMEDPAERLSIIEAEPIISAMLDQENLRSSPLLNHE